MSSDTAVERPAVPDVRGGPAPAEGTGDYGGHRLRPGHYEPDRVPPAVACHGGVPDTLPTGSPGKIGLLQLEFARPHERTELVAQYQKSPLQIMHPLYYDPLRPDMPYTYLMSTGAGIMQGDRLRTDLAFGAGSAAHLTTSAYTKVLRMEHDYAVAQVNLDVQPGAYVEYLPDPLIAFEQSRLYQRTRVRLAESATLLVGETVISGRLGRGERHAYTVLATDLEVRRPDGRVVALDRVRLTPRDGETGGAAVLGDRDVVSMLYAFSPDAPAGELGDLLHATLRPEFGDSLHVGVSTLPGDVGVWVRLVGGDSLTVARANTAAWRVLRHRLTGTEAPLIRKS